MAEPSREPPTEGDPRLSVRLDLRRELPPLAVLITLVGVLLAGLSELRFLELHAGTWDLGIYQQALWSTAHGRPFYESADLATGGYGSFLQVHSALALYAIVPVYSLAPDPSTLFAIQGGVVSLAALPLYLIARHLGVGRGRSFAFAGIYLLSLATVTSALYDFHIEAFVPLAFFGAAYLWLVRRWWAAVPAALVAMTVMEVLPVLLFIFAVFLVLERALSTPSPGPGAVRSRLTVAEMARRLVARPSWPDWGLAVGSVAGYYALLLLRTQWLHAAFGFPAFPAYNSGYVVGGTPSDLGLSLSYLGIGLFGKLTYWALLLLLTGLLPLRYPRALLLVAPWFAFTLLSSDLNYTTVGFQYGFLSGAPLFLASAWGLARLRVRAPTTEVVAPTGHLSDRARRTLPRSRLAVLGLVLLAANILLSPLDPLMVGGGPGAAYQIDYAPPASLAPIRALVGLIPADAALVASDLLFPLVANDVNAHTLFYGVNPDYVLPYNLTTLPPYALISVARLFAVPLWLSDTAYLSSDFGIRGVAWTSPIGPAVLFEHGYSGPVAYFGAPPSTRATFAPSTLSYTAAARAEANATSPTGAKAASVNGATGQLWSAPGLALPPGNYSVTVWLHVKVVAGAASQADAPVFTVAGSPFALPDILSETVDGVAFTGAGFHPMTANFSISRPVFDLTLRGDSLSPAVQIDVAEIVLTPA